MANHRQEFEKTVAQIDELVGNVKRTGHVDQVQSVAALGARCAIALTGALGQVWDALFDVKRTLATASTEASKQTAALVKWTKVLAFATAAYTVITGGLLVLAILTIARS